MRKLLFVVVLVVGLCLSTAVGNCAIGQHGFTDTDVVRVSGNTGNAVLVPQRLTFNFPPHIQPGERLYVAWWIDNRGNCPLFVSVAVTGVPGYLRAEFRPGTGFAMGPGSRKNVALVVTMPKGYNLPGHQNRSFTITVTFTSRSVAHRFTWPGF